MQRDSHLFAFNGNDIHEAAMAEHDYHTERVDLWRSRIGTVADAVATVKFHELSASQFLTEADLYGKFPEDTFLLDMDDVVHFRLAAGIPRED